jgi:phage terminase large subunit
MIIDTIQNATSTFGRANNAKAFEGAYFSRILSEAREEGRIGPLSADPLCPLRAFWDIGGAGDKADATAIWITQWTGQVVRVLDYCEGQGQVLAYYVEWLRSKKYNPICILPHDGINANNVTGKRYLDHLTDAGFEVYAVPNMGAGAKLQRIEAVRRVMPSCWFNEKTTEAGRDALGFYHERRDENRDVGLGPEHDWSSHAADAFGLMAVCYQGPDDPMKVDSLFERERGSYSIHATRSEITGY